MKIRNLPHYILTMKLSIASILLWASACSYSTNNVTENKTQNPILGTWQFLSAQTIVGEDTSYKDYTQGMKGIKMLNEDHFAFFSHDLNKGQDSTAAYGSGSGPYTYEDGHYTEYLEFCSARQWEDNTFEFELTVTGDTLIQEGRERIEDLGVDRIIRETYVRLK